LRRYAEALAPGFVGLYQANAQSTRSLTGRGELTWMITSLLLVYTDIIHLEWVESARRPDRYRAVHIQHHHFRFL
jgi:hypothetical protein